MEQEGNMTDREKLIELLKTIPYLIPAWHCTYEEAADWLNERGVVLQKHGRWEDIVDFGGGNCWGYCSVCKTEHKARNATALRVGYKYCPNCGAIMKLEGEDA